MLARQEEPLSKEQEERKLLREKSKEPLYRTVLNTRFRSHCRTLFLVAAALAMAVTIQSGISASRGYKLIAVQKQAEDVERENARLRIEIAQMKSPERIKSIAQDQLGMQVPKKTYFAHDAGNP